MECPKRKHPRLKHHDYGENGAYFVTFCVKDRRSLLGSIVCGSDGAAYVDLSRAGEITQRYLDRMETVYPGVILEASQIMPDHVHLLLRLDEPESGGMRASRPTVQMVVRAVKRLTAMEFGQSIWQESFYDHVVRTEEDFREILRYIQENPQRRWERNVP